MTKADRESPPSYRYEPIRALRALRVLLANPDDTAQVFTIIEALSGRAPLRMLERFRATKTGADLLARRPDILPVLRDRAYLESLPVGSLGRAYLAFLDREGISADGLVEASVVGESGSFGITGDIAYIRDRMRDTHDLWHTVTGYQGDVFGEASLLAFSVAQTKNPGVALMVFGALARSRSGDLVQMVTRGFRDGLRAEFLPPVIWEELLPLPLDDVRRRLSIEPVPAYEPVRSSWLRETGELPVPA